MLRSSARTGTCSKEHVVLSTFAEARLAARRPSGVADLLRDVLEPPTPRIGALAYEEFLPPKEQRAPAQTSTCSSRPRS
ncbi:MAG: hypothetical protein U0414_39395 [Polyangiaceae bacterium]